MKVEEFDIKYLKFSEVNNKKPQIDQHVSSNGNKSYSFIIKDFLKYPDEFANVIASLPHFKNEKENTGRPGKTFSFHDMQLAKFSFFIRECLFDIFKINLVCTDLYTNCFSGIMDTHIIPPHCDVQDHNNIIIGPHLVSNLGLTKNSKGGTSFWTYLKKSGFLDMSYVEMNGYYNYMQENNKINDSSEWNPTIDDGEWKLEYIVPWGYNDLVVYSPMLFHQPHFKKEWYLDNDRLSLASMYNIKIEEIDMIPEDLHKDAFDIWKKFELCKILNYYF